MTSNTVPTKKEQKLSSVFLGCAKKKVKPCHVGNHCIGLCSGTNLLSSFSLSSSRHVGSLQDRTEDGQTLSRLELRGEGQEPRVFHRQVCIQFTQNHHLGPVAGRGRQQNNRSQLCQCIQTYREVMDLKCYVYLVVNTNTSFSFFW